MSEELCRRIAEAVKDEHQAPIDYEYLADLVHKEQDNLSQSDVSTIVATIGDERRHEAFVLDLYKRRCKHG